MNDISWHSIKVKIKDLQDYPNNPRHITKEGFKKLVESLQQDGYHQRIIADINNRVIGGHQRKKALIAAGYSENDEIEILRANRELTEEEFKRINIRDNLQHGEWDLDILANNFEADLLVDWGFDEKLLGIRRDANEGLTDPDELPEPGAHPISQIGDIWLLGHHRIMCGDATNINTLGGLIDGAAIDLVFTDPPYNLETKGGEKYETGKALGRVGRSIETIADFNPTNFLNVLTFPFKKNFCNAYIFSNKELLPQYLSWAKENKISFNVLIWKKPNAIPLGGSHLPDIEYLLLFRKNAIWNGGLNNVNYSRCLEYQREISKNHPTCKPVDLISNELKISSNKNSIVLDYFLGSGSTLIACEKSERICYGMELEPNYIDTAIRRWQEFTGLKAIHESRNKTFAEIEAERLKDVA